MAAATFLTDSAGNIIFVGGILKAGALTTPINVTIGDITGTRGHFGTDGAFTASYIGVEVNSKGFYASGTLPNDGLSLGISQSVTMTAAGPVIAFSPTQTIPAAADGSLGLSGTYTQIPTGDCTILYGFFQAQRISTITAGKTVTTMEAFVGRSEFNSSNGAVTNSYTFVALPPVLIGGTVKPANQFGMYISNQGMAGITNSYGLVIDGPSASTNNYALAVNGVGATTHAGDPTVGGTVGSTGYIDVLIDGIARKLLFW